MQTQCPQCYSSEIVIAKPRPFWIWMIPIFVIDISIVLIIISGTVENPIPFIIGLMVADMLLSLPLMRAIRQNAQTSGKYYCTSCGYSWTEESTTGAQMIPDNDDYSSSSNFGISTQSDGSFQMTVEDVFSIKGRGTVVTGKVESGSVSLNNTVEIQRTDGTVLQTVVDGVEKFNRTLQHAEAGDNVGILLRNVGKEDIGRGDMLKGVW